MPEPNALIFKHSQNDHLCTDENRIDPTDGFAKKQCFNSAVIKQSIDEGKLWRVEQKEMDTVKVKGKAIPVKIRERNEAATNRINSYPYLISKQLVIPECLYRGYG